jgi:hypothetical protein
MDKNKRFQSDDNLPLCRFGPGGEFVTNWSGKKVSKVSHRPIGSLLKTIAQMLDAVITEELLQNSTIEKINLAIQNSDSTINTENKIDFYKPNESNAPAAPGPETDKQLQEEPMLFDHAAGTCRPVGHKPNHSFRTRRGAKRKRTAFSQSWQGSLFEHYDQSAKVA